MTQEIKPRTSRVWWTDTGTTPVPGKDSSAEASVSSNDRHAVFRQRKVVDEVIARNDKAERIFEAERMRLYCDLHHLRQQELAEQHKNYLFPSKFIEGSVATRLLKKKIENKLNGLQHLFRNREREVRRSEFVASSVTLSYVSSGGNIITRSEA
jgi:hypothetical protein